MGDSVLSLIISDYLFRKYTNYNEGLLTKIKSSLVSNQTLCELSKKLELGDFILLGHGEESSGGRQRENMLEDLFEAIVGAIYLDAGIVEAKNFIIKTYKEKLNDLNISNSYKDYKSIFQEIIQKEYKINPKYLTKEIENDMFKSEVIVNNKSYAAGSGKSKKDAETQDEKKFVFYYHDSNPRIVEIGVPASTWAESEKMYRHYIRELTEEEKATVAGFGLEYKVIPYNEKYLKTHDDGGKSVNGSFLEQEENEGKPSVYGWTSMLNLQESHVWEFMPNDAMRVKSFVFLVRQRATKDAVQSQALAGKPIFFQVSSPLFPALFSNNIPRLAANEALQLFSAVCPSISQ